MDRSPISSCRITLALPKCSCQVRHLIALEPELKVNYCHVAVVSTDPPDIVAAFRAGLGASGTRSPPARASGLMAPRHNLKKRSKRAIHGVRIRKCRGDIRIKDDDIGSLSEPRGILAANPAAKVVFFSHLIDAVVTGSFPHTLTALAASRVSH